MERRTDVTCCRKTLAIHLGDYIQEIKARIERPSVLPMAAMTQMGVTVYRPVFFVDGTMWNGAQYLSFDPQTHAWQRKGAHYFPGNLDRYWPGKPRWKELTGGAQ